MTLSPTATVNPFLSSWDVFSGCGDRFKEHRRVFKEFKVKCAAWAKEFINEIASSMPQRYNGSMPPWAKTFRVYTDRVLPRLRHADTAYRTQERYPLIEHSKRKRRAFLHNLAEEK